MRQRLWGIGIVGLAGAASCAGPALDLPREHGLVLELSLEPAAAASAAPAVFRGRLQDAPSGAEPWLFRGDLSDYHDRAVRQRQLSGPLLERAVPLRYWREQQDCLLQPLVWLQPGESYTLALTGYGRVQTLRVSDQVSARATRFFPPADAPKRTSAVLCGANLVEAPSAFTLEPGAVPLRVTPGAFGTPLEGCATLVAERSLLEPVVAPPAIAGVLLEPSAFTPIPWSKAEHATCATGTLVADACLEVEDDRAFVTPLGDAVLWLLQEPRDVQLPVRAFERVTLLGGLRPATELELRGQVISSAGRSSVLELRIATQPERRHLVLSEVLANALGPEPDSEWIEVVNDSERPAELSGIWLEDANGRVALPAQQLKPHETALLVAASFRESGLDVPFPKASRVLQLPSLGQRGLSNSGEVLLLVGAEGVLSRFPMLAAAHAGRSMARRSLDAADDSARSFAEHGGPGASPGMANFFD